MVENIGRIFSVQLAAWVVAVGLLVRWFHARNERLRDTASEKAGDWTRLRDEIERLDRRCDHLQNEVDSCREREANWMARAIAAEAYQLGEGEAKQAAQRIVSAERTSKKDGK